MIEDSFLRDLLERITRVETQVKEIMENHLPSLSEDLKWIRSRLNRGYRPPWSVAILISFLCSLCVGLMVTLFKGG